MKNFIKNLFGKLVLSIIIGVILMGIWHPSVFQDASKMKKEIVGPPQETFRLSFGNGYKTSFNYYMTEEKADLYIKIFNESPITLKIRTYKEYQKQYISKIAKKYKKDANTWAGENITGQYVYGLPVEGWPNRFIYIKTRPNPHKMMGTYLHELGHHECYTNKCTHCERHGHQHISEHHAILNEIEEIIKYNFPEVLEASFEKYNGWLNSYKNYKENQEYADSVLTIQDSKLWDEVKKFSNKHSIKVPIFKKPTE